MKIARFYLICTKTLIANNIKQRLLINKKKLFRIIINVLIIFYIPFCFELTPYQCQC